MKIVEKLKKELCSLPDGSYREEEKCFRSDIDSGGMIIMYPLFPGIVLSWIKIRPQELKVPEQVEHSLVKNHIIKLNWCRSGRCEMITENNNFIYIKSNEISISTEQARNKFRYPAKTYTGIEIFLSIDEIVENGETFIPYDIDFSNFEHRFMNGSDTQISAVPEKVRNILNSMYQSIEQKVESKLSNLTGGSVTSPNESDQFLINGNDNNDVLVPRLRVLTVELFFLLMHDVLLKETATHPHLLPKQVKVARMAEEILTLDLSKPVSISTAAAQLGISATTLKRFFYNVYDMNVSEYMKKKRMEKASELLKDRSVSVASIASAVGYSSTGHFSKAFREYYGETPLNYRNFRKVTIKD
ncbi:helix-turn-helix domain-containing protein [Oribacterium sp. WCC10]|uniref:helix-turn-helix domain-containing protein n=1 Tax=Oribacterium sp. WCC10 TaxID=1855343 RepID=UPI001587093B|nr:helix-turn-helix domain-containing protein [Oribacterium sp. WCC10]